MTHHDPFGQLRSLMNHPNWTHVETYQLSQLVIAFADKYPTEYQHVWLPYLNGFKHKWDNEVFFCQSIQGFETLSKRLPQAKMSLLFDQAMLGDQEIQELVQMPHIKRVTSINWSYNQIGDDGAQALAEANFEQLEALHLGAFQRVGDRGFTALCNAPWGTHLKTLDVSGPITDDGILALANSTTLTALETLWLKSHELSTRGISLIANSKHLSTLRELYIATHLLNPESQHILMHSPYIKTSAFQRFLNI